MTAQGDILSTAMNYVRRGWAVIPVPYSSLTR
jgi:hypothetical protein